MGPRAYERIAWRVWQCVGQCSPSAARSARRRSSQHADAALREPRLLHALLPTPLSRAAPPQTLSATTRKRMAAKAIQVRARQPRDWRQRRMRPLAAACTWRLLPAAAARAAFQTLTLPPTPKGLRAGKDLVQSLASALAGMAMTSQQVIKRTCMRRGPCNALACGRHAHPCCCDPHARHAPCPAPQWEASAASASASGRELMERLQQTAADLHSVTSQLRAAEAEKLAAAREAAAAGAAAAEAQAELRALAAALGDK